MTTDDLARLSLVLVAVSTLVVAWQTLLLRRQTALANQVARGNAGNDVLALLHPTLHLFLAEPGLRRHFHDSLPLPDGQESAERVLVVAELLADAVEAGCELAEQHADARARLAGWRDYGQFLLANSPALTGIVREHPLWWPRLAGLLGAAP